MEIAQMLSYKDTKIMRLKNRRIIVQKFEDYVTVTIVILLNASDYKKGSLKKDFDGVSKPRFGKVVVYKELHLTMNGANALMVALIALLNSNLDIPKGEFTFNIGVKLKHKFP